MCHTSRTNLQPSYVTALLANIINFLIKYNGTEVEVAIIIQFFAKFCASK